MDDSAQLAAEWRRLCLRRLRRFAQLANTPTVLLIPELRQLTRRSVLSAYRDCLDIGIGEQARRVIADAWSAVPSTPQV
jgi:hypothetical protein